MLKSAIFYSSQNGSTKKVAEKIRTVLVNEGVAVSLFNVTQNIKIDFENYDLIGIGCPTYISRPSYEILDFVNSLKSIANKKVFTFVTFSTEIGDGANWLRKVIAKKGGIDIGHLKCSGKNLFPGYTKNGYVFCSSSPTNNELSLIEPFVKKVLLAIKNNNNNFIPYDPKPGFIYRLERFVTNCFIVKYFYSHFFTIDKKKCSNCDICIKNCPMNNISKDKKDQKKWGRNCILCLKCEISCTGHAINSPISWFIFKPFLGINIKDAIKRKIPYQKI